MFSILWGRKWGTDRLGNLPRDIRNPLWDYSSQVFSLTLSPLAIFSTISNSIVIWYFDYIFPTTTSWTHLNISNCPLPILIGQPTLTGNIFRTKSTILPKNILLFLYSPPSITSHYPCILHTKSLASSSPHRPLVVKPSGSFPNDYHPCPLLPSLPTLSTATAWLRFRPSSGLQQVSHSLNKLSSLTKKLAIS